MTLPMIRATRKILTRGQDVGYTENENPYLIGLTPGCDGVPSTPEVLRRGCAAYHRIPFQLGCTSRWSSVPCMSLLSQFQQTQRLDTDVLFVEYRHHVIQTRCQASPDWGHNAQTDSAVERIVELVGG